MYTRIRELREHLGMTQDDLGKRVGVRRETIVFLEKGKYNPSLRLAREVACVFGKPIEEVFLFDDENPGETVGTGKPGN